MIDLFIAIFLGGLVALFSSKESVAFLLLSFVVVGTTLICDVYSFSTLCIALAAVMCTRERPLFPMLLCFGWMFFCFSLRFFDFYSALAVRIAICASVVIWLVSIVTSYIFFVGEKGEAIDEHTRLARLSRCRVCAALAMFVLYGVFAYLGIPFFVKNGLLAMGMCCLLSAIPLFRLRLDFASSLFGCLLGGMFFLSLCGGALTYFSDINSKIVLWGVAAGLAGSLAIHSDAEKRMSHIIIAWLSGASLSFLICYFAK